MTQPKRLLRYPNGGVDIGVAAQSQEEARSGLGCYGFESASLDTVASAK